MPVKTGGILITYSHGDHIIELPRLKKATGAPVLAKLSDNGQLMD